MSKTSQPLLTDKIALVTGASRGIGEAVAKCLAKAGAHVIITARTAGALESLSDTIHEAGGSATIVPLNLKHGDKIDQLGGVIAERWGKLDILVANAGILGRLAPMSHFPVNIWKDVMEVNVNANWRLIRSLDALLQQSDAGRAVFVTSGIVNAAIPFWGAYAASKAALESLVRSYAAEQASTKLKVNLIDPGVVATNMRAAAMPGEDPDTLPKPEDITDVFLQAVSPDCSKQGEILHALSY